MWLTGPAALRHVGSSQTRARTRVPCIGRQILNHCATREALSIICPGSAGMQVFLFPHNFFVFCCWRRRLSRCKHCSRGSQVPGPSLSQQQAITRVKKDDTGLSLKGGGYRKREEKACGQGLEQKRGTPLPRVTTPTRSAQPSECIWPLWLREEKGPLTAGDGSGPASQALVLPEAGPGSTSAPDKATWSWWIKRKRSPVSDQRWNKGGNVNTVQTPTTSRHPMLAHVGDYCFLTDSSF